MIRKFKNKRTFTEAVDCVGGGDLASGDGANADETAERTGGQI
jgi:hypothetical protein